ncbi:beta-N-acetylhexosaminidase [Bacillus sp. REN16]|uniref:beta-N-acetylhexosaminidase n=1 Tax=Bacillus sp. REN16 TaxID=2887296 RepID=UPI001E3AEBFC|nr:beta-N-acetylhexosaminidase [Bacillus sp. REN16]MCC3357898.1 beta-N-acetylhexosaminidase [Bacillus sp. REN16]
MKQKGLLIGIIGIISVVLVISFLYFNNNRSEKNDQAAPSYESLQPDADEEIVDDQEEPPKEETDILTLVKEVYSLAEKGKVPQTSFIAGQTKLEEIQELWGEPQTIDNTSIGDFMVYPDHDVTIGIKDQLAFDIRSNASSLTGIHLDDIKNTLGEPDEVRYYQDKNVNQTILIYQVNSTFQLKWILPKPTEQEPNPTVHHINVVTGIQKSVDEDESLSLDKKIGQMIFAGISGTKMNSNMNNLITKYHVGGIIFNGDNLVSPKQTVTYLNKIKQANQGNIPLFFGVDQEGGRISKLPGGLIDFPTNLEIGSRNDPSLSFEIGTVLGKELHAFGFNVNFAPVLDVNSNPDNPVIGNRSFSSNPEIVSRLGIQTMKGLQSQSIVSAVKHFPGHGDTQVDSHLELPKVNKTRAELENLELIPFRQAVKEGVDMVMIGHILVPALDKTFPSSMSKPIITDILRKQLGFNGVVITDDFFMKAITNDYEIGEAAIQSIKAGSDIVMVAHDYNKVIEVHTAIKNAVTNGEISEKRIDESIERILQLKEKYKLNDSPVQPVNVDVLNQEIEQVLSR